MPGDDQGCACPVRPLSRTTHTHRATAALLVLLAIVAPANAEQRIALVVTNQAYTQAGAALTNTHRDGDLVRAALERVGFKVTVVRDTPNETALVSAFGAHVQRLAEAGPDAIGFVYYSGHGAADRPDGANYLIPTGAPITHAAQLPLMAVRLDKITETLARVGRINFVVFDACRNVPLQRAEKDVSFKGWAPVKEQSGLLVAYATEPGNVAVDQSIYARALAEEIVQPGREASSAFRAVARRVIPETGNRQAPQYLDRRLHDFEFAALARPPEPGPRPQIAPAPAVVQPPAPQPPPIAAPSKSPPQAAPVAQRPPSQFSVQANRVANGVQIATPRPIDPLECEARCFGEATCVGYEYVTNGCRCTLFSRIVSTTPTQASSFVATRVAAAPPATAAPPKEAPPTASRPGIVASLLAATTGTGEIGPLSLAPAAENRVVITQVAPASRAATAGLTKGDVIFSVDDSTYTYFSGFRRALEGLAASGRERAFLRVKSEAQPARYVVVDLAELVPS